MGCFGMKMRNLTTKGIARRATARRARLDGVVAQMHAAYTAEGLSFADLGRRYGRHQKSIRDLFKLRGLSIRPSAQSEKARTSTGSFAPAPLLTEEQIDAIIAATIGPRLRVPAAIKNEWRDWPMMRRRDFIARLRAHLNLPDERPTGPFSANVEPFDYGHPSAHAIVTAANAGLSFHSAGVKIRICSQGVIWGGALWFWAHKVGYQRGPFVPGQGRPALHHAIWEQHHGRSVPPAHVIRHIDGNPNNLAPENLQLMTRDQLCRENQAAALAEKSRALTAALLTRSQNPKASSHENILHLRLQR